MNYRVVADIFSQISRGYDLFLGLVTAGRIHAWQRDLINDLGKNGNWLDIGTGTGEILKKLGEDYPYLRVGVDPAVGMLRVAKEKCSPCYFVAAVGESLPFKERSFSRISLSLVFRHLEDQKAFLREARRVLEREGKLGIVDVGRFSGTGILVFLMKTVLKPFGLLIFGKEKWDFFVNSVEESYSVEEVRDMLEEEGFSVEKIRRRFFGIVYIMTAFRTA